ncbi:uncharacterized protein LOC115985345 [Quercus lobata]|uniref:uncharacterized protein LOC115985345 n=1 Tax=Quercus lobata TaxID=97700 RepID=UPI001247943C|nr:uncharacterized protein LOC115985345 [Quercus lobata]
MSNTETFLSFLITKLWQLRLYFYTLLRSPKHLILLYLVFLSMSRTIADFPPNPEDGELWIPSDVLHEIVSTDIDDATYDHVGPAAIQPNLEQPHDSFLGTKPDGNGAIGSGVPASDGYASWDGAYPRVSGHIHQYDSFNPTQIQGFGKNGAPVFPGKQNNSWSVNAREEVNGFVAKSEGTGFFLPRFTNSSKGPKDTTGGGKKGQAANQKKRDNGKEAMENQEDSHQLSDELGLPKDWTY